MTEYKNERNHKKLLVPIIALILCATAMVGFVYAAQTSTVTNQANVIYGDGLIAELRVGSEGDLLEGKMFSENADKIEFGTHSINDEMTYSVAGATGVKLGGATLFLQTINSDTESVNITYTVSFAKGEGLVLNHGLKVGTNVISSSGNLAVGVSEAGIEYSIELVADIEATNNLGDMPEIEYDITITVTPV